MSTEDKLLNAQKEIIKVMEEEERTEALVEEISKEIFERLMAKGKCDYHVNEREYSFKMNHTDSFVAIAAIDKMKFKIARDKYKPFFIRSVVEKEIGLEETIFGCVRAFVMKQYGIIKAEEEN